MTQTENIVTIPKAAAICKAEGWGLSHRNIRGLVLSKRLPYFKNGNRHYINMELLRAALKDPNSTIWRESVSE